jgi:hypothetical protein
MARDQMARAGQAPGRPAGGKTPEITRFGS